MKRVLFLLHMPPPVHGASLVGKYIHDSKTVNASYECEYINLSSSVKIDEVGKFGFGKISRLFSIRRQAINALSGSSFDLVYVTPSVTGTGFLKDFVLVRTLKRYNVPIALHLHNKGVSTKQHNLLYNWAYRSFFRGVDVILLSERLYDDISRYVPRERVHICPNGIPDSASGRPPKRRNKASLNILYLSNMMKEKGVDDLLEACSILRQEGVPFHCDFVGGWKDITEKDFLSRVHSLGLDDCLTAHGPMYGGQKNQMLENADVFVFPTFYSNECFPLVLLEAMQYAIPCVSTDEAAIPDIIDNQKTGFICKKHSPKAIADAIEALSCDKEMWQDMSACGRKRYEDNFSSASFERTLKDCFDSIIRLD